MRKIVPGVIVGGVFGAGIFASQVLFPNPGEDKAWVVLGVYLLLFFSYFAAGFWYKKTGGRGGGIRIGIITAVVSFLMIMLAYFIIDNAFTGTVAQQGSKIAGFAASRYPDMRQYLNATLLKGLAVGLPLVAAFGGVCGGLGGLAAAIISKKSRAKLPHLLYFVRLMFPYALIITLFTGMSYAVGQQVMRQSANDPQIQIARDTAMKLSQGESPYSFAAPSVEISQSLSPFLMIYDQSGRVIVSTARLDQTETYLPPGVLDYTGRHGQDTVTWQPRDGVRMAVAVVRYVSPGSSGYVAVGRSLQEVESRTERLGYQLIAGWIISLGAVFFSLAIWEILNRTEEKNARS